MSEIDQDAIKADLLDLGYTPAMLADELKEALHVAGVDEGVKGSIHCFQRIDPGGIPVAYCRVDVCPAAMVEYTRRLSECIESCKQKGFHVEQITMPDWHRDLTQFQIIVRYERPGSI